MKKRLHFPLLLMVFICAQFLSISTLIAQTEYKWQNPLPQGNTLYCVSFIDANTGTAVGYTGTILRTTDGGLNWNFQESGLTDGERLWGVDFTDANNGTVVGDMGKILHTTDGGVTWNQQTSGTTVTLNSVDFTNANTGTAVGVDGKILHTTNGGANWISQTSGTPNTLYGVSFTDANTGTAVGMSGTILRTTDGGATWNYQFNLANYIYGVCFTDANNGTIVGGEGTILHTTDGGLNWISQTSGTGSTLVGVSFLNADTGFISTCGGEMLRTTDGGVNWIKQTGVSASQLYGISFSDANHGTAVGEMGKIVHTTDGGLNWHNQSSSITSNILNSVSFSDAIHGTAVGDSCRIVRTNDGGVTWNLQNSGLGITDIPLKSVSFSDAMNGTAVGFYGKVLRTTDGGANWNQQTSGTTAMLFGVSFSDTNHGLVVGQSRILRTTNGGVTWTPKTTTWSLYGVCMIGDNTGTAVGSQGRIVRTTDGGVTWTSQTSYTTKLLYGVSFADANNGVVVGQGGVILRTTDGGAHWITITGPTTLALYSVSRADINNLTAVAMSGVVIKSTDGGLHWSKIITSENYLFGVSCTDTNNVTVVGQAGVILAIHNNVPNQPSIIIGAATPCAGSSQNYSVTSVSGVTYNWTFPTGWTQTGGGTTNAIIVTAGVDSGNIIVTPSNAWGSGTARTLAVTPSQIPAQPSAITGPVNPAEGSSQVYSVINVAGITYSWTFPTGWVQTGGDKTNSVTVTVGSGAGDIVVTPSTLCGDGVSQTLAVVPAAPMAYAVTGGGSYCEGGSGLPVGVANSEPGVIYTIFKDGVAQVPTVAGTGSAITFGNQFFGTYTVSGTNGGGTTPMTGSAVITETLAVAVSVNISADINPTPAGTLVTLTALPVNGGVTPSYQWSVNETNTGTNNDFFSYIPANNDAITCTLISSETCTAGNPATSNQVVIKVIPQTTNLQNIIVANGETKCYNAVQTIYVAGGASTFTVQSGGSAAMIAGQNIVYMPGTTVEPGGYLLGIITTTGQYCNQAAAPMVAVKMAEEAAPVATALSFFRVYPNPTSGAFTLEINGESETGETKVEIFSMRGGRVFNSEISGSGKHELTLSGKPVGIYMIRVISGSKTETARIIKQ